jgi:hypothetical protein
MVLNTVAECAIFTLFLKIGLFSINYHDIMCSVYILKKLWVQPGGIYGRGHFLKRDSCNT